MSDRKISTVETKTRTYSKIISTGPSFSSFSFISDLTLFNFLTKYSALKTSLGQYSIKDSKKQLLELIKTYNSLPLQSLNQIKSKSIFLAKIPGKESKKTIIFELDETLIHCCKLSQVSHISISINLKFGGQINSGLLLRPFAMDCLQKASELFEVIIFTTSEQSYANAVMDFLDPKHELIDFRLFKNSCIDINGGLVKDLRIFINRKLKDIIIIDNSGYSFLNQIDNGVPITSWYGEHYDKKLLFLIEYMQLLVTAHDIRDLNRKTFGYDNNLV